MAGETDTQPVAAPPTGTATASPPGFRAPRLSKSLLETPAGKEAYRTSLEQQVKYQYNQYGTRGPVSLTDSDKFNSELLLLLSHIRERASGNLDEAWMGTSGYNWGKDFESLVVQARTQKKKPTELITKDNASLGGLAAFYDSGEEAWARAFAEMAVFSMYHTPNQAYGGSDDPSWYGKFPGAYSVAMACQTLSTYCLLSRGFDLKADIAGIGLGCAAASAGDKAFGAKQVKEVKPPAEADKDKDATTLGKEGKMLYAPPWATTKDMAALKCEAGSVLIYNSGGSKYPSQDADPKGNNDAATHIASVLRACGESFQIIDTGVITGSDGTETEGEGGTVDHGFLKGGIKKPKALVAMGAARHVDDGALLGLADKIAAAKPLGVTRLAIANSGKNVLFLSKLMHMKWPVSHLAWSLRNLPVDGLLVAWLVFTPRAKAWAEGLAGAVASASPDPASLFTGSGLLAWANVLVSNDKGGINIYRTRLFTQWRQDFGVGESPPKDVFGWKVGSATLGKFAVDPGTFGQCFVSGGATTDATFDKLGA